MILNYTKYPALVAVLILSSAAPVFAADSTIAVCPKPEENSPTTLPFEVSIAACKALNPKPEEIRALLLAALKPYVRKTTREVSFYHYGWRTKRYPDGAPKDRWDDSYPFPTEGKPDDFTGPVDPQAHGATQEYVRLHLEGHWNLLGDDNDEFGRALYTATDPFASITYSGKFPLLVRVGVPAGMGYLDLRGIHRDVPLKNAQDADIMNCYFLNQCKDQRCTEDFLSILKFAKEGKKGPIVDPKEFIRHDEARKIIKSVYQELGVEFIAGGYGRYQYPECRVNPDLSGMADAVFLDPSSLSKLKLDALTESLESNPSPEKRKLYEEVLQYFDAFDFDEANGTDFTRWQSDSLLDPTKGRWVPDEGTVTWFWRYYGAWAPVIHHLPPGADLKEFQRKLSKELKATRSQITSKLFGCSKDSKNQSEIRAQE